MEEKEKEKSKGKGKEKEKEKEKEKGARAAHNHIERKYRSKLNNTISELRDAVPSLQKLSEAEAEGGESSRPARGSRINKVSNSRVVCYISLSTRVTKSYLGHHPGEGDRIHPTTREDEP